MGVNRTSGKFKDLRWLGFLANYHFSQELKSEIPLSQGRYRSGDRFMPFGEMNLGKLNIEES
jgi:hypothetical protein